MVCVGVTESGSYITETAPMTVFIAARSNNRYAGGLDRR